MKEIWVDKKRDNQKEDMRMRVMIQSLVDKEVIQTFPPVYEECELHEVYRLLTETHPYTYKKARKEQTWKKTIQVEITVF